MFKVILAVLLPVLLVLAVGLSGAPPAVMTGEAEAQPPLEAEVLADGLVRPWGIAVLPDGTVLFTERGGALKRIPPGGEAVEVAVLADTAVGGEGGLLGLALDAEFASNRYLYLARNLNAGAPEVRVSRFVLSEAFELLDEVAIVSGIPANPSGRHSGTQLAMSADGVLWIGTGDAANGAAPQDPASLGGKILRVDRDGNGVAGNLGAPFDPRIFSYGHRNTQGLVLLPEPRDGVYGYSAEHGSWIEDEVNPLVPGNFGWAPGLPYDEDVPMTDLARFPDAVAAAWQSGDRTIAVSGLAILRGEAWGALDGRLVVGVLKDQHIRLPDLSGEGRDILWFEGEFGRIRAVQLGPDDALYVGTDNGTDDKIVRVRPNGGD